MTAGRFERIAKGALLLALFALVLASVGLVVSTDRLVQTADRTVAALPAQIDRQAAETRNAALLAISDTRKDALGEIANLRRDLLTRVDSLSAKADQQLTSTRQEVLAQVDGLRYTANSRIGDTLKLADAAIAEVRNLHAEVSPILMNAAQITEHANAASAILLRRDALPAQILGLTAAAKVTLGESAQTMRTIRDSTPKFVAQGQAIATDFQGITANINRLTKPHWYDRLLGYTLNGAILFRQLHPATNLTVKGAEFISSQK